MKTLIFHYLGSLLKEIGVQNICSNPSNASYIVQTLILCSKNLKLESKRHIAIYETQVILQQRQNLSNQNPQTESAHESF